MKNLAACLILIAGSGTPALGQWTIDATVGVAAPVSGNGFRTGVDLMGAVEQRPFERIPLAVRLEVGWDKIGLPSITRYDLDAVVDPPLLGTRLRPYVLAGFGLYKASVFGTSQTDFGLNAGGGLRYPLGPVQPFFEVRYHIDYVRVAPITFIPLQFGARIPLH